jgi:hypothetical protein
VARKRWIPMRLSRARRRGALAVLVTAALAVVGLWVLTGPAMGSAEPTPAVLLPVPLTVGPPTRPAGQVEPYDGAPGARLAIIGDSITRQGHEGLHRRFGGSRPVSVDGRDGFTVAQQFPTARAYAGQRPAPTTVVINLGTNDAGWSVPLADTEVAAEATLRLFDPARCIVVVTVNANTPDRARNERSSAINDRVWRAAARRDARIRIADWDGLVRAAYARGEPEGPLTRDTIHPTELGQRELAELIGATVETCPR